MLSESKQLAEDLMTSGDLDFLDMSLWDCFVKPVEPIVKGVEKAKGAYTKKAQKVYNDYFSVGPKSGEFGTGAAGALYGFALPYDDKLFGVELPEELQGGVTEKFSRAALGFMMGYSGVKLAKKTLSFFIFSKLDKIFKF